ncbi:prolyl oligopeptidase family serine peptidase [Saccharobesus litoralis]|nr:prolyl oligopeptidase family serine peptidase [Saccharobesus litoralis]
MQNCRNFLLCLFILLGVCQSCFAALKIPDLASYAALPENTLVRLSPNGKQIAFRYYNGERDMLIVQDLQTGDMVAGADLQNIDVENIYFLDETRLIMVAGSEQKLAGYRGRHQVSKAFIFNLTNKKMRLLLSPGEGIDIGQTDVGRIVGLSADGQYAYMPAYKGREEIRDSDSPFALVKVKLDNNRDPRRVKNGKGTADTIDYFVNDKDQIIARERYNNTTNEHRVQSLQDGKWVDIFKHTTDFMTHSFVGITADYQSLVMTALGDNDRRNYYTLSLKDGSIQDTQLSRDDADIEAVITNINRVVFGVQYSGFKPSYRFFDSKVDKTMAAIIKALPNDVVEIHDWSADWSSLILLLEGESSTGDYVLFKNGQFQPIASQRPAISVAQTYPVEISQFSARDGLTIPTLVTYPHQAKQQLPAIVLPHGGPESYDRFGFDWLSQYFASKGLLVIQPQFRGSKGFGAEFLVKGRGEWGRKSQQDISDAVQYYIKQGLVDKDKVCIVGGSYGGYAALAGVTLTPELYQCAVSINGLSDLNEMLQNERDDHGSKSQTYAYWQKVIRNNTLSSHELEAVSPIKQLAKLKVPVLLIHAKDDKRVPYAQSEDFYQAAQKAGKNVQYIELKQAGHVIDNNAARLQTLTAIDKFIEQYLLQ